MTPEGSRTRLKTLERGFDIIEYLLREDGARLTEVANETAMAKSTVHRHLTTLEDLEYVTTEGSVYFPSFRFVEIGEYVKVRKKAYRLAQVTVEELANETGERAQFFIEEHGHAVYVCIETGKHGVQTDARVGKRIPLHATAGGKAILANLPREEIHAIIDERGLPPLTDETITEKDRLIEELEGTKKRGYGRNIQEYSPGSCAVGVPVFGQDNVVIGALSVTGPVLRMQGEFFEEEVPTLLKGTANELELKISYS